MSDLLARPRTPEDRVNDMLVTVTRLRRQVAELTAERDRLTRQMQAPFPSYAELARQRMWAHLRTVTARLVGAAGLFAVAAGAFAIAAGIFRGVTG